MNDKPKRRWFQIHLSTMILLILISGFMLYPAVEVYKDLTSTFAGNGKHEPGINYVLYHWREFVYAGVLFLLMLGSVAFFCEWCIRRRETRKSSQG